MGQMPTGAASKADQHGLGSYPDIIREPLVFVRMLTSSGVAPTYDHVRTILLLRPHDRLAVFATIAIWQVAELVTLRRRG